MEAVLQNYAFPIFSTDCDTTEEQFKSMTEWLKHNTTPSSQVHIFMEKTAVKRAEWIRGNTGQGLQKVVQEFPRLFDTPGMVSKIVSV